MLTATMMVTHWRKVTATRSDLNWVTHSQMGFRLLKAIKTGFHSLMVTPTPKDSATRSETMMAIRSPMETARQTDLS